MVKKQSKVQLRLYLAQMLCSRTPADVNVQVPMAFNTFNTILIDLEVLKLVEHSGTGANVTDDSIIIDITEIGIKTYTLMRKLVMNKKVKS